MSTRANLFSTAATSVVLLCTLAMTATVVRREYFTGAATGSDVSRPERISNWTEIASVGHRTGPENAPLTVVVFSDFECPFCRAFATDFFPNLTQEFPGQVAMVFRHWPLDMHRFAYPAARAAECAGQQGRFKEFHDVVFANQKMLGLKTFSEMARESGVKNVAQFETCASDSAQVPAITRDVDAVTRLKGRGTPTVIVNGWILRGGVTRQRLDSLAKSVLVPRRAAGGS